MFDPGIFEPFGRAEPVSGLVLIIPILLAGECLRSSDGRVETKMALSELPETCSVSDSDGDGDA